MAEIANRISLTTEDLADLMEAKMRRIRWETTRWLIGTVIAATGVIVGVYLNSRVDPQKTETSQRETPQVVVPDPVSSTPTVLADDAVIPGDEGEAFDLPNSFEGIYEITATAVDNDNIDPMLTVYERGAFGELVEIAFNDDSFELNSRVVVILDADASYEILVEDFRGDGGVVDVNMRQLN